MCFLSFLQIDTYKAKFAVFFSELKEMSNKVEILQSSMDKYITLEFELLRIELREFEALVTQIMDSLNVTSPMFDSLYVEVTKKRLLKKNKQRQNKQQESDVGNFTYDLTIVPYRSAT